MTQAINNNNNKSNIYNNDCNSSGFTDINPRYFKEGE